MHVCPGAGQLPTKATSARIAFERTSGSRSSFPRLRSSAATTFRKVFMKALLFKVAAVAILTVLAVAAWSFAQSLVATFFPVVSPRPLSEMVVCALAGAAAAALVSSVPLARLFASRAWLVAFVLAAPVAFLRLPEIASYSGALESDVKVMGILELGCFVMAVVGGAWLVSRHRPSGSSSQGRHPSGAT